MVWKLQVTGNQGQILWVRVSAYRIHTHQSTWPSPPRLYETLVKCYLFVCLSSWHLMSLPFFDPCCAINDFGQGQPGKYSRPRSSVFSQVLKWMARGSDMLPRSFRDRRCLHLSRNQQVVRDLEITSYFFISCVSVGLSSLVIKWVPVTVYYAECCSTYLVSGSWRYLKSILDPSCTMALPGMWYCSKNWTSTMARKCWLILYQEHLIGNAGPPVAFCSFELCIWCQLSQRPQEHDKGTFLM